MSSNHERPSSLYFGSLHTEERDRNMPWLSFRFIEGEAASSAFSDAGGGEEPPYNGTRQLLLWEEAAAESDWVR